MRSYISLILVYIVYHFEMQTEMTKLSTTLNAEEGTWVESEEKDTSEGGVSFAPGNVNVNVTFLM